MKKNMWGTHLEEELAGSLSDELSQKKEKKEKKKLYASLNMKARELKVDLNKSSCQDSCWIGGRILSEYSSNYKYRPRSTSEEQTQSHSLPT